MVLKEGLGPRTHPLPPPHHRPRMPQVVGALLEEVWVSWENNLENTEERHACGQGTGRGAGDLWPVICLPFPWPGGCPS